MTRVVAPANVVRKAQQYHVSNCPHRDVKEALTQARAHILRLSLRALRNPAFVSASHAHVCHTQIRDGCAMGAESSSMANQMDNESTESQYYEKLPIKLRQVSVA